MSRKEFPAKVKVAAFQRANGHCENCTAKLHVGKYAFDHDNPDGLTGEPTLANCRVLCTACHAVKTRTQDVPNIAKAKRRELRHMGIKKPSRGFRKPKDTKFDWHLGRYVRQG